MWSVEAQKGKMQEMYCWNLETKVLLSRWPKIYFFPVKNRSFAKFK